MAIYLIRHGETASNAARVVQTPETPLSERGIAQAELLARRLASEGLSDILSSDLPRALMTAERIQVSTGAVLHLDALLQERNYGDIRGRAYADVGADILGPDYEPPGGERWSEFPRAGRSRLGGDHACRCPSERRPRGRHARARLRLARAASLASPGRCRGSAPLGQYVAHGHRQAAAVECASAQFDGASRRGFC